MAFGFININFVHYLQNKTSFIHFLYEWRNIWIIYKSALFWFCYSVVNCVFLVSCSFMNSFVFCYNLTEIHVTASVWFYFQSLMMNPEKGMKKKTHTKVKPRLDKIPTRDIKVWLSGGQKCAMLHILSHMN